MKTAALLILLILQIQSEEVPIPQGPGTPIEQLGTQQIVEGNYRDTTAWRQRTLQTDYEGQIQEIQQRPRIITERVTAPPKVLTERVTTDPRYISDRVEAPIKQRIITQPTIMNEYVKAQPQFNRGQDQYVNRNPVYLPTKYDQEIINKPVNLPGNTVTNRTYVQPVSKTIREQVQIQNAPEIRRNLEPIYRDVQTQNFDRTKTVQVPANYVYRQDVVQPIYQRENVRLNVQQEPSKTFNKDPVTLPVQFEERTVAKNVNVPGGTIYKQQTIYPTVTNEKVDIQFQKNEPVYRDAPVQELLPIIRRNSEQVNHQVTHHVPEYSNIPVPVPMVHKVPEFKDVPVYFKLPEKKEEDYAMNVREIENDIDRMLREQGYEGFGRRSRRRVSDKSEEEDKKRKRSNHIQDADEYCGPDENGHDEYMHRKRQAEAMMKNKNKPRNYQRKYNPNISDLY